MSPPATVDPDALAGLVAAAAARVRWDAENGVRGYRREQASPRTSREAVAPPLREPVPATVAPTAEPQAALEALRGEIGDCHRCPLGAGRTRVVFGEGAPRPRLVFVGEGPGHDEDLSGRPFVGAAGQLLDKIIGAMGLARSDVYICNVVKCRPPSNRAPEALEMATCGAFLERQLEILAPEVIVALGATATSYLLGSEAPMRERRGRFFDRGPARLMPTYHPAYLLRSPEAKRPVWEDMQQVMAALRLGPPAGGRA